MNRILLCLAFIGCTFLASSQKVYFIYVQAEPGQAFYLKMNEKVFSSTASGYLILSRLRDSTYSFSIGFPGNKWPDQRFTVTMEKKDHGYMLKNFGDKGWGLFDLQTLAVLMAVQSESNKEGARKTENKDASDFANVLSKAADDPSLKEKPVPVKPAEPKTVAVKEPVEKSPVVAKTEVEIKPVEDPALKEKPVLPKTDEPKTVLVKEPAEKTPVVTNTEVVSKSADDPSAKGKTAQPKPEEPKIVAISQPEDKAPVTKTETVTKEEPKNTVSTVKPETPEAPKEQEVKVKEEPAVISQQPAETEKLTEYKATVVTRRSESSTTEGFGLTFTDLYGDGVADTIRILIPNPKPVVVVPVAEKQEPKEERKFLETDTVTAVATEIKTDQAKPEEKTAASTTVKNNCPAVADENDFLRIRKRMAAETSDDNMIAEAKKILKTKCFSTVQIKNLGLLFLNDEGKYKFFDAAYASVSDPGNYPSLESELKDTYYINRFKAMLRS